MVLCAQSMKTPVPSDEILILVNTGELQNTLTHTNTHMNGHKKRYLVENGSKA